MAEHPGGPSGPTGPTGPGEHSDPARGDRPDPRPAPGGRTADDGAAPRGAHRVRRAVPADVPVLDAMVRELAAYEREADAVRALPDDLRAALFGPGATAGALVAEVAGQDGAPEVVGMAVWFTTYSTWTGRGGTWLEDLFVRPAARGRGLGRALLAELAAAAVARGHQRLEWAVLDWNTPAQAVYRAVGAAPQEEWTTWRLTGDALAALASTAAGATGATAAGGALGGLGGPDPEAPIGPAGFTSRDTGGTMGT